MKGEQRIIIKVKVIHTHASYYLPLFRRCFPCICTDLQGLRVSGSENRKEILPAVSTLTAHLY